MTLLFMKFFNVCSVDKLLEELSNNSLNIKVLYLSFQDRWTSAEFKLQNQRISPSYYELNKMM